MDVVFLSPAWPLEMPNYVRALGATGARVHGVGDGPDATGLGLASYLRVPNLSDLSDVRTRVVDAGRRSGLRIARVEALWEPLTTLAAELRRDFGVQGMSPEAVLGFRDKGVMRARVAAAGLRTPKTERVSDEKGAWSAAKRVGYPLIVKPVAGAGSADTYRCDGPESLRAALQATAGHAERMVEEFVRGPEYTYETLCIDGKPVYESVCRYEPNTLIARQNAWISPIIQSLRHGDHRELAPGITLGRAVLSALGMGTGLTHMEWFLTDDGEVIFGEVACRPPGANMVDLMNYSDDADLYRAWADAVCWGRPPQHRGGDDRPYSAAIIFKRAEGEGRIHTVLGLNRFMAQHHGRVVRNNLLPLGAERRNWKETFLSDGDVVVRHPDGAACLAIARQFAQDVRLYAG